MATAIDAGDSGFDGAWKLVGVVRVDATYRVQCQCKSCGNSVYAQIHMILRQDGRIECWGSTCYARELGAIAASRNVKAMFPGLAGRPLTQEERELLTHNRTALIERFRFEHARELEESRLRLREERKRALDAERRRREERASFLNALGARMAQPSTVPGDPRDWGDLHARAYELVRERWVKAELDPALPGWVGAFEKEVNIEAQRLAENRG